MKKALFLIGLLIASCFPFAFAATDEGYGEDQTALGQSVDTFDTSDNISVAVNVIRNATLECMELNYTAGAGGIYEDLTVWVEDDGDGDLTVIPSTCTFTTMRRDSDSIISLDGGAGNIDDFMINFTLQITDLEAGDASNIIQMWAFAVGNGNTRVGLFGAGIWVALQQVGTTDDIFRYVLRQREGAVWVVTIVDGTNYGLVTHYLTLIRTGTNVTLNIFSDEARTRPNRIEHLSDAAGSGLNYRYYAASVAYDVVGDPADHASGNVRNVSLGLPLGGGYDPDGYFTTPDYMNNTLCNGTSLGLMLNSTIPYGTDIQVQFSNDNATWGDWEGIPLDSNILAGGFETIDLRYLNETDVYLRFNLSTTDNSLTPRIYQARLISTIGAGNGTGAAPGPSGGGAIGLIMLILICSPLIVLVVWGSKRR